MKNTTDTESSIDCVMNQATTFTHGFPIKQRHIRLEVNLFRAVKHKKPLGEEYFGRVMQLMQEKGLVRCIQATATPVGDDWKVWIWTGPRPPWARNVKDFEE